VASSLQVECTEEESRDLDSAAKEPTEINVTLSSIGGETTQVSVGKDATVRTIQDVAAQSSQVPSLMLVLGDKVLWNLDASLEDVGISDGTWLNIIMGQRYHGKIKRLSGPFGFLTCEKVAGLYNGADVFLHRRDYKEHAGSAPRPGDEVSFRLEFDKYGMPIAKEVTSTKNSAYCQGCAQITPET
jgi:cold shock CspA family protein